MMIKWNIYTNYKDFIFVNTIQKKNEKIVFLFKEEKKNKFVKIQKKEKIEKKI